MLNPNFRSAALGDNLLPPTGDVQVPSHPGNVLNGEEEQDKWVLWSGVSLSPDGNSFVLTSDSKQPVTNLTLSTRKLIPGQTYVLTFRYRNRDFKGDQRVYVSTYKDDGSLIDTFPYGEGFLAPPNSESGSAFAFVVPQAATNARLWLRTEGTGQAEFSDIELQPLK
jgi:WD40 repeat protein